MGKDTFTRSAYADSVRMFASTGGPATRRAEQKAHNTGKLHPLVDPAEYGVIRRSLPRFEQLEPSKLYEMTVGTPMPVEIRVDTTGSMGGNVDVAIRVLPETYELGCTVLPGYDLQMAIGIFGDVVDRFVLCRPQFEMVAEKLVEQLTLMVPERNGGDATEDPHYGLFGAAYLTDRYINRIGLKGYDFTVSDAPTREKLSPTQLTRIFGKEVFEKVAENGHQISKNDLPTAKEVVQDLLEQAHAFFLQVENDTWTSELWTKIFGPDRVVVLPSTQLLPQVQAVIIGLTEGTLGLDEVTEFLKTNNVSADNAKRIVRSVANIPIGAQSALPNYGRRPKMGDLFREKTDPWPVNPEEVDLGSSDVVSESDEGPVWL